MAQPGGSWSGEGPAGGSALAHPGDKGQGGLPRLPGPAGEVAFRPSREEEGAAAAGESGRPSRHAGGPAGIGAPAWPDIPAYLAFIPAQL
jgi:hypothetical protein